MQRRNVCKRRLAYASRLLAVAAAKAARDLIPTSKKGGPNYILGGIPGAGSVALPVDGLEWSSLDRANPAMVANFSERV